MIRLRLLFIQQSFYPYEASFGQRVTCLRRYLRSKELKWLEIDILLIVDDIRESYQIRGNLNNDFYESLVEDDWEIRGQTRLNQAMIVKLRDRQRGLELLNDARDSYTKANSYSGTLYVAHRRVHLSTENPDKTTITSLVSLSHKFRSAGMITLFFEIQMRSWAS